MSQQPLHDLNHFIHAVGLADQGACALRHGAAFNLRRDIPRRQRNGHVGAHAPCFTQQFDAAEAGHVVVGHQQVEVVGAGLQRLAGEQGVGKCADPVALAGQGALDQEGQRLVVIHVHHVVAIAIDNDAVDARRGWWGGDTVHWRRWKIQGENAAMPPTAADSHRPFVGAHDAVHHREPQAGTLAGCFGGEEGFEHPLLGGFVHAGAAVAHGQCHLASLSRQRDANPAAPGTDGLNAVGTQIQQGLLHLCRIGHHHDGLLSVLDHQFDRGWQTDFDQARCFPHHG